jgi:hypothetical protein
VADIGHSIGVGEFLGIESEFTGRVAQSQRLWGSKSKNFPRTEREEEIRSYRARLGLGLHCPFLPIIPRETL